MKSSSVTSRSLLVLVVALIAGGGGAGARVPAQQQHSQPAARFRAETNHIEINAVVVDGRGEFGPGLTAADFAILEDGRPQAVSTARAVNLPVERREMERVGPDAAAGGTDVLTNEHAQEARLYVLVLDDLHTDARRTPRVRGLARAFVTRYLQPGDVAAVLTTGLRAGTGRDFTSDSGGLVAAIDRFDGRKSPSVALTLLRAGCFDF